MCLCLVWLCRCVRCEVEEERGERGRVTGELAESRGQLTETQDRVATLEERVGQLAQLNSDLQTQLE